MVMVSGRLAASWQMSMPASTTPRLSIRRMNAKNQHASVAATTSPAGAGGGAGGKDGSG